MRSSRIALSLFIDHFRAFFCLAHSKIKCCDALDFIASLFVENTILKPQSIACQIAGYFSMGERSPVTGDSSSSRLTSSLLNLLILFKNPFLVFKDELEYCDLKSFVHLERKKMPATHERSFEVFSLETSESKADERYFFLFPLSDSN